MEQISEYIANTNFVELGVMIGTKLVLVLLIYLLGRWLARISQRVVEKLLRKREVDDVLVDFLGTIVNSLITVLAIVAALDTLGIPATSLLAVVGAAGLAIGLALKDSLSNFAAGVMLVMFRPFTKGDYVEAAGESGTVQEVYLVNTVLLTPDNKVTTIPNSAIWNNSIINYSANDTRRVDMVFGVGYDDDLKVAHDVLMKICTEHPKVLKDPEPKVFVSNLGDSSVDFACRPWVASDDYWGVYAEILQQAKIALEEAGCSIPYPQSDVHMRQVEAD